MSGDAFGPRSGAQPRMARGEDNPATAFSKALDERDLVLAAHWIRRAREDFGEEDAGKAFRRACLDSCVAEAWRGAPEREGMAALVRRIGPRLRDHWAFVLDVARALGPPATALALLGPKDALESIMGASRMRLAPSPATARSLCARLAAAASMRQAIGEEGLGPDMDELAGLCSEWLAGRDGGVGPAPWLREALGAETANALARMFGAPPPKDAAAEAEDWRRSMLMAMGGGLQSHAQAHLQAQAQAQQRLIALLPMSKPASPWAGPGAAAASGPHPARGRPADPEALGRLWAAALERHALGASAGPAPGASPAKGRSL